MLRGHLLISASTLAGILLHIQLAAAAGCDLPMFGGARLFAAGNDSRIVATGDFNNDGDLNGDGQLDLVLANVSGNNLLIFLGNGDGTFQNSSTTGTLFGGFYLDPA